MSVIVSNFNQNPNARTYFSKVPNMKFYDRSSGEGCAPPCGQKDVTRRIDRSSKLLHREDNGEGGEGEWSNRSGGEGRGRGENKKNNENENKVEERGRYKGE